MEWVRRLPGRTSLPPMSISMARRRDAPRSRQSGRPDIPDIDGPPKIRITALRKIQVEGRARAME